MKVLLLCWLLFASFPAAFCQQNAVVHLYRTGHREGKLHVRVDGHDIFKIENDHVATLAVPPGHHELWTGFEGLGSGNAPSGVVVIQARSGAEYYVHIDFEVSMARGLMGGGANAMHLLMQQEQGMPSGLKEQKLNSDELAEAAALKPLESAPQEATLPITAMTDDQMQAAIVQGSNDNNPQTIGLYLSDIQTRMFSGVTDNGATASTGFSIILYTPFHWVEYQAAIAHREMRPFSASDVTPEMRANVLHVVALPNTPDYLTAQGVAASSGVSRVVLCDKSCVKVVQPIAEDPSTVTIDSALRSKDYTSLASAFNYAEVERLRSLDKQAEFYVVVIGDSGARKFFAVKKKYAAWL